MPSLAGSEMCIRVRNTFLYYKVQKWVEGGGHWGSPDTKRKLALRKRHFFVVEKYIEDARQEEKDPGSAGSDNEAHLSCKRRDTAKIDEIDSI